MPRELSDTTRKQRKRGIIDLSKPEEYYMADLQRMYAWKRKAAFHSGFEISDTYHTLDE